METTHPPYPRSCRGLSGFPRSVPSGPPPSGTTADFGRANSRRRRRHTARGRRTMPCHRPCAGRRPGRTGRHCPPGRTPGR
ncbi:hypothetical protein ACFFX0_01290 [Citricoccus parietis]|uniref:Uncharacterized protein n=1 Tax=Citricoccus parietis TaxID=592307 RepID=A0ABV5FT86_9MICC